MVVQLQEAVYMSGARARCHVHLSHAYSCNTFAHPRCTWKVRRRGVRGVRAPRVRILRALRGVSVHISGLGGENSPSRTGNVVCVPAEHGVVRDLEAAVRAWAAQAA